MFIQVMAFGLLSLVSRAGPATSCAPGLAARPFLYRFEGERGSFLVLGTKHAGLSLEQYPAVVREVVASADEFVFETKREPGLWFAFRSLLAMQRRSEPLLSQRLSREEFVRLVAMTEMRPQAIDRLTPFGAALMCLVRSEGIGFKEGQVGLDDDVRRRARAAGRRIVGLEKSTTHLKLLQNTLDLGALRRMIANYGSEKKNAQDVFVTGDAKALESSLTKMKHDDPELWRVTHAERNEAWMPKIESAASRRGRTLVVVGANHLFGEKGLIELFAARGFRVTRVED